MSTDDPSSLQAPLLYQNQITVAHIYKVRPENLKELFEANNLEVDHGTSQSLLKLQQFGFVDGLMHKLATDSETGIIGDERDLLRRSSFFGKNKKPLPQLPPIFESLKDAIDDKVLLALLAAAVFTMITGTLASDNPALGWVQGFSIILMVAVIVIITTFNDHMKDTQLVKLQSKLEDQYIGVIRGKYGATQTVNIYNLVVGDVILLETGAKIPADCVLIDGTDLVTDESFYDEDESGEQILKHKTEATPDNFDRNPDPFLLSQTLVVKGAGKAVVTCVGENSRRGIEAQKLDTETNTPLQNKLENLATTFTQWGLYAALVILLVLIIEIIITDLANSTKFSGWLDDIANAFTLAICIVVVAVPEGLPLTINLALAYSVGKMEDEKILMRTLPSLEVLGGVEEICTGKTGTLTKNDMRVEAFYTQSRLIQNNRDNTFLQCDLLKQAIDIVVESILFNCQARIEMNKDAYYVPVGNGTECGLIKFLQKNDICVHEIIKKKLFKVRTQIPFNPHRKRSIVALQHPDMDDIVRVYVKGAPEIVIAKCTKTIGINGQVSHMNDEEQNYILQDVVASKFASDGLRCIAFAYKDMNIDEFERLKQQYNEFDIEQDRDILERDLIFGGVFGLRDEQRKNVRGAVLYGNKGQVSVRLISGDHLATAKRAAIDAGIISENEADQRNVCMTGEEFRNQIGEVRKALDEEGREKLMFSNKSIFQQVASRLKVLARADPQDKYHLVMGLQEFGKSIAVTGESIADVQALHAANVGFCMGSGVAAAKEAADMILTEDNFAATMHGVMWGRNLFQNIRKFIQFQVSVNFGVLGTVLIGTIWHGQTPLSIVQLLWINLVMDTFAALAIATEPPHASVIKGHPVRANDRLVTPILWRQIFGQAIYTIIVMIFLFIFGKPLFNLNWDRSQDYYTEDNQCNDKTVLLTIYFNTFFWIQWFNTMSCRKIGPKEFNMFERFFNNWLFILVLVFEAAFQYVLVYYARQLATTCALTSNEFYTGIVFGAISLIINILLKCTPVEWVDKIPVRVNEDVAGGENDPVMKAFKKGTSGSAFKKQPKAVPVPVEDHEE